MLRLVTGWALLVSGTALLVLPGPGIPLMLGGLALLAREQAWAGRLQRSLIDRWGRLRERRAARRTSTAAPPGGTGRSL
jgi:hypothetical protein